FALPVGDYHTDRVVVATTAPGEAPGDRDATFAVNEAGRVGPIGRIGPSLLGHAERARLGSSRPRSRYTSGTTASRRSAESRPTSAPGSSSSATSASIALSERATERWTVTSSPPAATPGDARFQAWRTPAQIPSSRATAAEASSRF